MLKVFYKVRYLRRKYRHRILALRRLVIRNKKSRKKIISKILVLIVLFLSLQQIGQGSYIYVKAVFAQYLIASAWDKTLRGQHQVAPWKWADTWPVAKLSSQKHDTELYILAGDNGRTLAFGPGYRFGTALPGKIGTSIISGHRDTHFMFLQNIEVNDVLEIENTMGDVIRYRVNSTEIVSIDDAVVLDDDLNSKITLVTCYPFDSVLTGGKLRYIVTADRVGELYSKLP